MTLEVEGCDNRIIRYRAESFRKMCSQESSESISRMGGIASSQIHVPLESQNVTLFRNRVFEDVIKRSY